MSDDKKNLKNVRKGTPSGNVEYVIGNAAKSLEKSVTEAEKVIQKVREVSDLCDDLTQKIAIKQVELSDLEVKFEEEHRRGRADLEIALKEDEARTVEGILERDKKVAVYKVDYDKTIADYNKLKTDYSSDVAKESAKVRTEEQQKYITQVEIINKTTEAQHATLVAELDAAKKQIEFYISQNKLLHDQLNSERLARVEEAKARGNAVVTVNSASK